jgi:hypothetical protein
MKIAENSGHINYVDYLGNGVSYWIMFSEEGILKHYFIKIWHKMCSE